MVFAVFAMLEEFVDKENGFEPYINYKANIMRKPEDDDEYTENYYKAITPIYNDLIAAYDWWKLNKDAYFDDGFITKKDGELTHHMTNVVKYHIYLWT